MRCLHSLHFRQFASISINVFVFLLRDIPHAGSTSWEKRKALKLTLKKTRFTKMKKKEEEEEEKRRRYQWSLTR